MKEKCAHVRGQFMHELVGIDLPLLPLHNTLRGPPISAVCSAMMLDNVTLKQLTAVVNHARMGSHQDGHKLAANSGQLSSTLRQA